MRAAVLDYSCLIEVFVGRRAHCLRFAALVGLLVSSGLHSAGSASGEASTDSATDDDMSPLPIKAPFRSPEAFFTLHIRIEGQTDEIIKEMNRTVSFTDVAKAVGVRCKLCLACGSGRLVTRCHLCFQVKSLQFNGIPLIADNIVGDLDYVEGDIGE